MGSGLTKKHSQNIKRCRENISQALKSLKQFLDIQEEHSREIDSFCFVCTYRHFEHFITQYKQDFKSYIPIRSEERFYAPKDKTKAQDRGLGISGYKIGGIKIIVYSNSTLFNSNRLNHKKLDYKIIVELHGFAQYDKNGEMKINTALSIEVLEYFLKTPRFAKLKAFDYAIDFREKMQISHQEAIKKIPALARLDMPRIQKYKTTLYLQKHAPIFGSQASLNCELENGALQRVCIYDKQVKNALEIPITRFEFRILFGEERLKFNGMEEKKTHKK